MCCFEYSGSRSNDFYWVQFYFLHEIILKVDGNDIKWKQIPLSFQTQQTDFENSIRLLKKYFREATSPNNML